MSTSLPTGRAFRQRLIPILALAVLAPAALARGDSLPDPADKSLSGAERVEALIEQIKRQQRQLRSLDARFVQIKHSSLLLEPEVARGTFCYQAPDLARWEFTEPNQTVMVIRDGEMLTWYRDLGTAERVRVDKHTAQIEQYLSATNSIERLERYFTMATSFPEDGRPYQIELTPRYSRVAKRLKKMTIWFDRERYVPVRLTYVEPDGDTTEFVFEQVQINPDLPPERFDVTLPDDVEVRTVDLAGT
ncbi:MAG: outer membrane lipoprotein carrier protein LolA [Acidobacteria bacterium]|nr:MAG: outer membrane lipoprotein carrier protein LolA [Acidobacteriota bacterium]